MRAVADEVRGLVADFSSFVSRGPAIAISAVGILLIGAHFVVEVGDSARLSSTEYVATLITGAAICVLGSALEISRTRQGRIATEAGIQAVAEQVPDAVRAEIERQLREAERGTPSAGVDVSR